MRRLKLYLAAGIGVFVLLWWVTAQCGDSAVRRIALGEMHGVQSSWTDVSQAGAMMATKGPSYFCRATAYGPFLIRVDYGWNSGGLSGDGGSVWYVWMFEATFRAHEFDHWSN